MVEGSSPFSQSSGLQCVEIEHTNQLCIPFLGNSYSLIVLFVVSGYKYARTPEKGQNDDHDLISVFITFLASARSVVKS
jgi:hypothetical protein